jgi:Rrf2 family protein
MMKMSDGVEWGIHCATVLSRLPEGATLPGKALAEFHGVSESYLLKHLKLLAAAKLLESVPGPYGGYRLARVPEKISLLDIVLAVDGPEPAFRCTEIRQRGPAAMPTKTYRSPCAINAAMLRAERAWRAELERTTIADINNEVMCAIDARALALATEWSEQNRRLAPQS